MPYPEELLYKDKMELSVDKILRYLNKDVTSVRVASTIFGRIMVQAGLATDNNGEIYEKGILFKKDSDSGPYVFKEKYSLNPISNSRQCKDFIQGKIERDHMPKSNNAIRKVIATEIVSALNENSYQDGIDIYIINQISRVFFENNCSEEGINKIIQIFNQKGYDYISDIRMSINSLNFLYDKLSWIFLISCFPPIPVKEESDYLITSIREAIRTKSAVFTENITGYMQNHSLKCENDLFIQRYSNERNPIDSRLFLEEGNSIVSLKDVFVIPRIKNGIGNCSLIDRLHYWVNGSAYENSMITDAASPILVIRGNAGIGKTSLISHLLYNNIFNNKAYAIFLRKHASDFTQDDPWGSIKKAYHCLDDNEYNDKILILDGFDELCVINNSIHGEEFLQMLSKVLPTNVNVKILITSRISNGYYGEINPIVGRISIVDLLWTTNEMTQWGTKYLAARKNDIEIENWWRGFIDAFHSLDNKIQEIMCIPLILYICCHESIEITTTPSISQIYNSAFKKIAKREYGKYDNPKELISNDIDNEKVLWQFVKELAFQMFLNNMSETMDDTLIENAKNETKRIMKLDYSYDTILDNYLERLPTIFYFSTASTSCLEFVHRSVAEYFTALKLYEDFLEVLGDKAKYNDVWKALIGMFRYKRLPYTISHLFIQICIEKRKLQFWANRMPQIFIQGLKESKIVECMGKMEYPIMLKKDASNYDALMMTQISYLFCNLTDFMTALGYKNDTDEIICKKINIYTHEIGSVNCACWNFENADLQYSNFKESVFINAQLQKANLRHSNFTFARLENANLKGADLFEARLLGARLNNANLENTNLIGADLRATDIDKANSVYGAEYDEYTKFRVYPKICVNLQSSV